ncbi:MAG: hypothetical protein K8S16_06495, partial [Bacteroidales bacterium]|nr:hypothetical protein [Bacteroidales bacterium]
MKNHIFLSIVFLLLIFLLNTKVNAQCVQCDANSNASGNYSSVIGMSSLATSDGAFAGGFGCEADGSLSFSFGNQNIVGGTNSVAIGRFLETTTSPAMIFGTGSELNDKLINGISNSLMIGFNSNKPTFFVKGAPGNSLTGKIGIGDITDPQAKLHIKADDGEPARLFIEPHTFGVGNSELWLGTQDYGLTASYNRLNFKTESYYLFNS